MKTKIKKILLLSLMLLISANASAAKFMIENVASTTYPVFIRYEICIANDCKPESETVLPGKTFEKIIDLPPGKIATVIGKMGTMNGITVYFGRGCRVEFENHQQSTFRLDHRPDKEALVCVPLG